MKKLKRVRRKSYSVEKKLEIITWHRENGALLRRTSKEFGIDPKNLREWIKNETLLRKNDSGTFKKKRKIGSGRKPLSEEMDDELYDFFIKEKKNGRIVSNQILSEEAKKIAARIGIMEFSASAHYVTNFKKRFNITFKVGAIRQKELAALREAGLLSDVPETSSAVQDLSLVQPTSTITNASVPDVDTTEVISGVSREIDPSQVASTSTAVTDGYTVPVAEGIVENSSVGQIISGVVPTTLPVSVTPEKNTPVVRTHHRSIGTQAGGHSKSLKPSRLKPITINGRRIIDFEYFFNALKDVNCHSPLGCNLNDMVVTNERKCGLTSNYTLKCTMCSFERKIWSHSLLKNMNSDFVSGILSIQCSLKTANKLLGKMQLPRLSEPQFKKATDEIENKKKKKEKNICFSSPETNVESDMSPSVSMESSFPTASSSDTTFQQVDLGKILVEDQIEIKEECNVENESETIIPDLTNRTSDDKTVVGHEQMPFDVSMIKQEIDSDADDDGPKTNEMEISSLKHGKSKFSLPQQKEVKLCEKRTDNQDKFTEGLPRKKIRTYERVLNEQSTELTEKDAKRTPSIEKCTNVSKPNLSDMITTSSKNVRIPCYKTKSDKIVTDQQVPIFNYEKTKNNSYGLDINNPKNIQGTPTTSADKEKACTQSSSETSGPVTGTSTTGGGNVYVIPVQDMTGGSGTLIVPCNTSSGSNQGITGTSVAQQADKQKGGILPLAAMHSQWTNSLNTSVQNPLIILPGVGATTYLPGAPTAIQQPVNLSNMSPNISRTTFVPLASTVVQQPGNSSIIQQPGSSTIMQQSENSSMMQQPGSSTIMQQSGNSSMMQQPGNPAIMQQPGNPAIMQQSGNPPNDGQRGNPPNNGQPRNVEGPRWIGRANMNDNDPFYTLPGGAPKGVSDLSPPKSDSSQSDHPSKRPRFRCDDCDVNFAKYESLDLHKKSYCIKRLKLPPSSTVTSDVLTNNPLQPTGATSAVKPEIGELLSAMAVKRSYLEASMKTALDAQYIINLHKSAQDLSRKTFKEFDNALNREKALTPKASIEEQQIASEARAQALIRAEAAYKQEKYSAAAVEQALFRQKTTIEATLAATEHEQTALISTLKGLKLQANQNSLPSAVQDKNDNRYETSFNQGKLINASFAQNTDIQHQQTADNLPSTLAPTFKNTLSRSDVFMKQKSEFCSNLELPLNDLSQPKVTNRAVLQNNHTSPFHIRNKILPSECFQSQKMLHHKTATSPEASSTSINENKIKPYGFMQTQESRNLSASFSSENIRAAICQIDKGFTENVHPVEMMDASVAPSNDTTHILTNDVRQNKTSHDLLYKIRKLSDTVCTKDDFNISLSMI